MTEMTNTNGNQMIGVAVSRQEKDQMKDFFKSKADYVASDDFEKKFDAGIDFAKGTVAVLGTTATIVLAICPLDGPVGEIVTGLATPGLVAAVDALGEGLKGMYKDSKKIYSGSVNADTGKVETRKALSDDTLTSVQNFTTSLGNVRTSSSELKNMLNNKPSTASNVIQNTTVK